MNLREYLNENRKQVEEALAYWLPPGDKRPQSLHQAMRYSVMNGGKRLRPIIVLTAARMGRELLGHSDTDITQPRNIAMRAACALEMIHCYSLVHDDLPCMDDDDLRRGKPTCHIVYGDAIATLAGDALQSLAYETLSDGPPEEAPLALDLIRRLSLGAGHLGMVGGQVVDLECENVDVDAATLEFIHRCKTGALYVASVTLGGVASGNLKLLPDLERFGEKMGLMFQIVDDIMDVEGDTAVIGKPAGSDESKKKATYPRIHGMEKAKSEAVRLTEEAKSVLAPYGAAGQRLAEIADYILSRAFSQTEA